MEARLFTGWMYDTLTPYPERLEAAHPAMLKAIVAAKNKNDQLDAATIADLLRLSRAQFELFRLAQQRLMRGLERHPSLRERVARRRGHRNTATLAVARKLVAYLLAVDRRQSDFKVEHQT